MEKFANSVMSKLYEIYSLFLLLEIYLTAL